MEEFKLAVAEKLNLLPTDIYGRNLPLSEIIVMSDTATNSIDIMEAFAYALAIQGWDELLGMPAMTLDHSIDEVILEIERQLLANSTELTINS